MVGEISRRLAELLAVPASRVSVKLEPFVPGDENNRADLLVSAGNFNFAVEWKASGQASAVAMAIRSIRRFVEKSRRKFIPLVAVPFIGEVGQKMCEEAQVCWLDLSGNAHLSGPGLRVTAWPAFCLSPSLTSWPVSLPFPSSPSCHLRDSEWLV